MLTSIWVHWALLVLLPFVSSLNFFTNGTAQETRSGRSKRTIPRFKEFSKYTTPEIIYKSGYPVEVHKVLTKDGYILEMHRIPGPHRSKKAYISNLPGRGRAVFIQHCVLCSSGDFVINDPHTAISFVLADHGFDVWLGNYRGNFYSKNHIRMSPDNKDFWKFSFMEMADYDIPAQIYYVLEKTGADKIAYVGHSMGTTGLFAALAMNPEINDKLSVMAALAPVAYFKHVKYLFRLMVVAAKMFFKLLESLNLAEVGGRKQWNADFAINFCYPESPFMPFCDLILPLVMGLNPGYISEDHIAVVLSHFSTGTSVRTLAHFGQLAKSEKFEMFDMGPVENLIHYGMLRPPPFNLSNTKIPVGLFWSENDYVAHPLDVRRLASELPNVVLDYKVPQEDFNHTDFLFSKFAYELVFKPLLDLLLAYS